MFCLTICKDSLLLYLLTIYGDSSLLFSLLFCPFLFLSFFAASLLVVAAVDQLQLDCPFSSLGVAPPILLRAPGSLLLRSRPRRQALPKLRGCSTSPLRWRHCRPRGPLLCLGSSSSLVLPGARRLLRLRPLTALALTATSHDRQSNCGPGWREPNSPTALGLSQKCYELHVINWSRYKYKFWYINWNINLHINFDINLNVNLYMSLNINLYIHFKI